MEISKIKITSENPNFKFKNVVKHMDCCFGINDIFDIYYDKNNNFELYLISPSENFSIAITRLKDNQLIKSLQGHNQKITSLRCFYDEIKQNLKKILVLYLLFVIILIFLVNLNI